MSGAGGRVFALFRVAAGPRLGHGHLRRAEALAAALGRPACVSVRGRGAPTTLATIPPRPPAGAIDASRPAVLVLDDPSATASLAWCRAARERGIPVVSLHDLGLGQIPSTLAIDGSVTSPQRGWPSSSVLRGLAHAMIRPPRRSRRNGTVRRVLISLGGGPRCTLIGALAREIGRRWPGLDIVVPSAVASARERLAGPADRFGRAGDRCVGHGQGFVAGDASPDGRDGRRGGVRVVAAPLGLADVLAGVDVAILGGGVSLYEAVAAGVPSIGVAVVPAQRATIAGFAARDLVCDGGVVERRSSHAVARRVADRLARIIEDPAWRRRVRREGPRAVDGRGVTRVARALVAVAEGRHA